MIETVFPTVTYFIQHLFNEMGAHPAQPTVFFKHFLFFGTGQERIERDSLVRNKNGDGFRLVLPGKVKRVLASQRPGVGNDITADLIYRQHYFPGFFEAEMGLVGPGLHKVRNFLQTGEGCRQQNFVFRNRPFPVHVPF